MSSHYEVKQIADHEGDEFHKTFDHDDLLLGFKFLADMLNRLAFVLIVVAEIVAFCSTIVTMPAENAGNFRLETLKKLEYQGYICPNSL